ncbi:MAG: hypothetical protein ABIG96_06725 [Candidatus Micrarchaeota archaeon]
MVLLQQKRIPYVNASNLRKDAKSQILSVLGREWPLSAKEIYNRIHAQAGESITYQGVHKAILQLAGDAVLTKTHSKYSISSDWIESIKKFGEELDSAFKGQRSIHLAEIGPNSSVQLVFDSMIEYFYWLLEELAANQLENGAEEGAFIISYHPWPITNLSKYQFDKLRKFLSAGKHFIACKGNSSLDKTLISLWKSAGTTAKLKAECSKNCDMLGYRDYVVQLFLPKNTKNALSRIFNARESQNGRALSNLYSLMYEKAEPVNVLVSRNPDLARQLREEVLLEFRN